MQIKTKTIGVRAPDELLLAFQRAFAETCRVHGIVDKVTIAHMAALLDFVRLTPDERLESIRRARSWDLELADLARQEPEPNPHPSPGQDEPEVQEPKVRKKK